MLQGLRFTITDPQEGPTEYTVDSDRALVGSAPHCEIRLASEQMDPEQLLFTASDAGVFVETRSSNFSPTINGVPVMSGRVFPDAVIECSGVRIVVEPVFGSIGADRTTEQKRKRHAGVLLPLLALGLVVLLLLAGIGRLLAPAPRPEMPEALPLWPATRASCPENKPERAGPKADSYLVLARAKRERSPFVPADGADAVELFEQASACLGVAGDKAQAKAAREEAARLREHLSDAYQVRQVALWYALHKNNWRQVRTETQLLLAFLGNRNGEYVTWLSNLERQAMLRVEAEREKAKGLKQESRER